MFVHGAGGGGWEWRVWARVFAAEGFAVSAPDLRPGGAGLAATSLADYLEQVRGWAVAARAGASRVVLVGASLGGLLAAANADLADALVLVNPLPPEGLAGAPAPGDIRAWGRDASLSGTRRALPDADAFTAQWAWRRWRDESGRVLAEARAGLPLHAPAIPVLVVASAADDEVPAAATRRLAEAWQADLVKVAGSHVGPLLGRTAAATAAQTVAWLNTRAFTGRIQG